MKQYLYNGPVMRFNSCINPKWSSSTYAVSEKKARSNLSYRYKKDNSLLASSNITLPGKLIVVREE